MHPATFRISPDELMAGGRIEVKAAQVVALNTAGGGVDPLEPNWAPEGTIPFDMLRA